jgi:uncharacterized membrane protein YraQ (UPF0718 family)
MTTHSEARPLQAVHGRGRLLLALAVGLLGVAVSLSPYAWLDAWQTYGFAQDYLGFHVWVAVPFWALSAIVALGRLSLPAAAATVPVLIAGTIPALEGAQSLHEHTVERAGLVPAFLLAVVAAAWGLDTHLRSGPGISLNWFRREPAARAERPVTVPLIAAVVLLTGLSVLAGRIFGLGDVDQAQTFLVIATSIVVEALPFVLLGALVSALLEVFVPDRAFAAVARLPLRLQVPGVALAGFAMPVCECGSVPVARRLILRGVHPSAGLAFMLASPIINPIVLLSTVVAYRGQGALEMTAGRALLGIVVALSAAAVMGRTTPGRLLRPRAKEPQAHSHGGGRLRAVADHLASDLLFMGRFVIAGAALAAAMQTLVPQSVFTGVLTTPLVGAGLLMVLGFVLSLCSEADAFVAVSFIQFPLGPQLAFLVFGPILDIKLALLYTATFGRTFVLRLLLVTAPIVLAGSMLYQGVAG